MLNSFGAWHKVADDTAIYICLCKFIKFHLSENASFYFVQLTVCFVVDSQINATNSLFSFIGT